MSLTAVRGEPSCPMISGPRSAMAARVVARLRPRGGIFHLSDTNAKVPDGARVHSRYACDVVLVTLGPTESIWHDERTHRVGVATRVRGLKRADY
jgi:hypothetical protein